MSATRIVERNSYSRMELHKGSCHVARTDITEKASGMEAFFAELEEAARRGDFTLPPGFQYQGGNPAAMRALIESELEKRDKRLGIRLFIFSVSVNLAGTRMPEAAGAHKKFKKQGDGLKNMVSTAAQVLEEMREYDLR